jgi:hypothetical protein
VTVLSGARPEEPFGAFADEFSGLRDGGFAGKRIEALGEKRGDSNGQDEQGKKETQRHTTGAPRPVPGIFPAARPAT